MKSSENPRPSSLFVDGEKIPEEDLQDIFQAPPRLPREFYRSSLIVGSRGAGKTTLLRVLNDNHQGLSERFDLTKELSPLCKQGFGPLASNIPPTLEPTIIGKAKSLTALALANSLPFRELRQDTALVQECLPASLRQPSRVFGTESLVETIRVVARAPMGDFENLADAPNLRDLVTAIGDAAQRVGRPLLLMFDRADMVPPPSIVPILELLDQSPSYVALVATRPTHSSLSVADFSQRVIALDHYDVYQLGEYPRSPDWQAFLAAAVRAQLKEAYDAIPERIRSAVMVLSRDSVKTALELFAAYVRAGSHPKESLINAIRDEQTKIVNVAQQNIFRYHVRLRDLLGEIRNEAREQSGGAHCRIVLEVMRRPRQDLFEPMGRWDSIAEAALRTGLLGIAEGEVWTPACQIGKVELSPLYTWNTRDGVDLPPEPTVQTIIRPESELFNIPQKDSRDAYIFVAYRMKSKESCEFRDNLAREIRNHPRLARIIHEGYGRSARPQVLGRGFPWRRGRWGSRFEVAPKGSFWGNRPVGYGGRLASWPASIVKPAW